MSDFGATVQNVKVSLANFHVSLFTSLCEFGILDPETGEL